ncbi:hypothetical protein ATANTOWER_013097 [Ataeniobius toweri]|uniref:Uncharacterized protein n=1 Tax=Ataeniobius toweri TaxID=208326 RepID=A0ABU7BSI9_9TELE|nr:hypothetical protein [Ataeniobius toweri]
MRVGMCDCDCVCLFLCQVGSWTAPSWISLGPSTPHYLPVVGVSAHWCTCGSQCPGLGALVCASSLPVAATRGLDPWALSGLCLGSDMSLRSLGPWLDLLGHRRLPVEPVGSSLQLTERYSAGQDMVKKKKKRNR